MYTFDLFVSYNHLNPSLTKYSVVRDGSYRLKLVVYKNQLISERKG